MPDQKDKCTRFAALHERDGAFVIPNPWDAGTARLLQGLGAEALATSSAGFAFTLAKSDSTPTLDEKLAHCRELAAATDIPVSVDFEDGFARAPAGVARNIEALIATGVAGCSIEDFDREKQEIIEFDLAVERVSAAAEVVAKLDFPFMLTARAENLLRGVQDMDDTIRRLQAFEAAGASVLYAPGLTRLEDVALVTSSVDGPVNVLGIMIPGASLADFSEAGAKRVSLGSALTYASLQPVIDAAEAMLQRGDFGWTTNMASGRRIQELLRQ